MNKQRAIGVYQIDGFGSSWLNKRMENPFKRSLPSRRMSVRGPRMKPVSSGGHQSFRLTKPLRKELIQKAFGSYTPEAFKKHLKVIRPKDMSDKEREYFARKLKDDRAITSKEDIQKFTQGFLEEAHEENVRLRTGFNPVRHEREQAKRLIKEMEKAQAPAEPPRNAAREEQREHRMAMARVRDRLGTQHGAYRAPAVTTPGIQAPEPLSTPPSQPAASAPIFSPSSQGFRGGRITTEPHAPPDVTAPGDAAPGSIDSGIPGTRAPITPSEAPSPDVQIPDATEAQDLPI